MSEPIEQQTADEQTAAPATTAPASEPIITRGSQNFDPTPFLMTFEKGRSKGKQYLEVKFRLLWLRAEHPDAVIETERVEGDASYTIFRARVSIPGRGSATGHKQETSGDFSDHLEKAETGSIGRALAALGFGTQFVEEHYEGRIADAPVAPRTTENSRGRASSQQKPAQTRKDGITKTQVEEIVALAKETMLDAHEFADLRDWIEEMFKVKSLRDLTHAQAERLIAELRKYALRIAEPLDEPPADAPERQDAEPVAAGALDSALYGDEPF